MKRHLRCSVTIVTVLLLAAITRQSYAQRAFQKLSAATDSTYGYASTNPIKLKNGSVERSILEEMNYLSGLTTTSKEHLVLVKRSSVLSPGYDPPLLKDRFSSKSGLLDKYVFLTANTNDTITLFIDIHNRGDVMVPVGLTYEQP
ncbi:MAG: hypothetical protein J7623_19725 [Chitinophaga sp.]|uniref:hypothetical protein n=1 Tax=Chitinophaga sp. TaxID=1869181 RepID=UPI001AFCEA8E|nr:hypothetical protein [Chitinophaga sp.]MBO9730879.1 hypothetical protein [Chitinophaga sp.]